MESHVANCAPQLNAANEQIAGQFSRLTDDFVSLQDYVDVLCTGK